LKRKLVLTVAAVPLAVLFVVAVVAPTLGQTGSSNSNSQIVIGGSGGEVALQLPPGNPSHPTDLVIGVSRINSTPAVDVMSVYLWVSNSNMYVPVAEITDNQNQTDVEWIKSMVNGSPVWNPPAAKNVFIVNNTTLEVTKVDDMIVANLTMPVNITLPAAFGNNFTLPPMTLYFHPIGASFNENKNFTIPFTNWTVTINAEVMPAWVQVHIPQWLGPTTSYKNVGEINVKTTVTYTPPANMTR
jgi:hypothetical protein